MLGHAVGDEKGARLSRGCRGAGAAFWHTLNNSRVGSRACVCGGVTPTHPSGRGRAINRERTQPKPHPDTRSPVGCAARLAPVRWRRQSGEGRGGEGPSEHCPKSPSVGPTLGAASRRRLAQRRGFVARVGRNARAARGGGGGGRLAFWRGPNGGRSKRPTLDGSRVNKLTFLGGTTPHGPRAFPAPTRLACAYFTHCCINPTTSRFVLRAHRTSLHRYSGTLITLRCACMPRRARAPEADRETGGRARPTWRRPQRRRRLWSLRSLTRTRKGWGWRSRR